MAKKSILIVEDDPDMQTIYKDILEEKYSLDIVGNTKDAMARLKDKKPDLMILDVILPGESGDTFFVHLRQIENFKKLKVLCITVIGDLTAQFRKMDSNVICLPKPFENHILTSTIEKMLKK